MNLGGEVMKRLKMDMIVAQTVMTRAIWSTATSSSSLLTFKRTKKALPTELVRHVILPNKPKHCVLRDDKRRRFYCEYQWCNRNNAECSLIIGWLDFVKANVLNEASRIRFYIKRDPMVVHACVLEY